VVAALGLSAVMQVGIVVMPDGWYTALHGGLSRGSVGGVLIGPDGTAWLLDRFDSGAFGDVMSAQAGGVPYRADTRDNESMLPKWSLFRETFGADVLSTEPQWESCYIQERAEGWPWRCVRGELYIVSTFKAPTGLLQSTRVRAGYAGLPRDIWIPYLPIWSGLALNLVVLALPWYVVFWAVGSGRRVSRRRRGRCAACGYDLAGLGGGTACPECGAVPRGREAVGVRGGEAALRSEPRG